ncbi:MAG: hypothetical protein NDJ89_02875 [Oligoflexia bacterium]|nr:hypothetical protein [Oligoflexia bacterium]
MNDLDTQRPLVLFGVPRCGSTPIYFALEALLRQRGGWSSLEEYFNWTHVDAWDEGSGIAISTRNQVPWPSGRGMSAEPHDMAGIGAEQLRRLELLRKYPRKFVLKQLVSFSRSPATEEIFSWLAGNARWVFLERRDLFEQLLSFLVTQARGVWYEARPVRVPDGSLHAHFGSFALFRKMMSVYRWFKNIMKPETVLEYEDFCSLGPAAFLARAGFENTRECDYSKALSVPIQNRGSKLALFDNPEEIRSWYSSLSR